MLLPAPLALPVHVPSVPPAHAASHSTQSPEAFPHAHRVGWIPADHIAQHPDRIQSRTTPVTTGAVYPELSPVPLSE